MSQLNRTILARMGDPTVTLMVTRAERRRIKARSDEIFGRRDGTPESQKAASVAWAQMVENIIGCKLPKTPQRYNISMQIVSTDYVLPRFQDWGQLLVRRL